LRGPHGLTFAGGKVWFTAEAAKAIGSYDPATDTLDLELTGQGVHGFTLDPSIGEFLLSHPNIRTPDIGRYLSVNDSYHIQWEPNVQNLMSYYRGQDGNRQPMSTRYVGSLVADFHRNLLGGGLFAYPANRRNTHGKLRLLYEASPLAFIVEQAGGAATDGHQRILDIQPTELHQRTPLFIGSANDVDAARKMLGGEVKSVSSLSPVGSVGA